MRPVRGEKNIADIGAKILPFARMQTLKKLIGIRKYDGPHSLPVELADPPEPKTRRTQTSTDVETDEFGAQVTPAVVAALRAIRSG